MMKDIEGDFDQGSKMIRDNYVRFLNQGLESLKDVFEIISLCQVIKYEIKIWLRKIWLEN